MRTQRGTNVCPRPLSSELVRATALRALLTIPLPPLQVPRVLGIDDFALRRGLFYATVLIDAETGRGSTSSPGRATDAGDWLREHPGAEVVCRDGSGAYGEAARKEVAARAGLLECARRPDLSLNTAGSRCRAARRAVHDRQGPGE